MREGKSNPNTVLYIQLAVASFIRNDSIWTRKMTTAIVSLLQLLSRLLERTRIHVTY